MFLLVLKQFLILAATWQRLLALRIERDVGGFESRQVFARPGRLFLLVARFSHLDGLVDVGRVPSSGRRRRRTIGTGRSHRFESLRKVHWEPGEFNWLPQWLKCNGYIACCSRGPGLILSKSKRFFYIEGVESLRSRNWQRGQEACYFE